MADIFLSYQKRDRVLAERVARGLRQLGFSVWWDQDVTPRENWDRTLEREIAAAQSVLVLWTRHSVESDWVRIEASYARRCQPSKLVQARFDDCDLPIAFSLIQYADLDDDEPAASAEWPRLLSWLGRPSHAPGVEVAEMWPEEEQALETPDRGASRLAAGAEADQAGAAPEPPWAVRRLDGAWRSSRWKSFGGGWPPEMWSGWPAPYA